MSTIYLIRHGQAGTRDDYDTLSEIGIQQARLLGEWLASRKIRFEQAFHGGLKRQRQTAQYVMEAYDRGGLWFPDLVEDAGWREFDLDEVYRGMVPHLCAADAEFKSAYEAQQAEVQAAGGEGTAAIHRKWSPCDMQVIESWVRSTYSMEGESWDAFRARVATAALPNDHEGHVAVFTSATPTAIQAAHTLDIHDERIMLMAGALLNTAITILRVRGPQARLFSFNNVPHLTEPEHLTFR